MLFGLFVLPFGSNVAVADHLVETHKLDCGKTFPCPKDLQRRVDFWIKVFREWGTDQVILHDEKYPERVFKVIKTRSTCSGRRAGRSVRRHRSAVDAQLRAISVKLKKGDKKFTREQKHYLRSFSRPTSSKVRSAANRIRCQQGNRDRFEQALIRYGTYRNLVQKVLREAGLPKDIEYLPFVESAYNPKAYSRVGAAGMWQIMPRTARTLGLQLSATIDERLDPEAATRAAARYFLESTKTLMVAARAKNPAVPKTEVNPFIITSYNYGVSGMRRAVRQFGPDYLTVLEKYRSRSFRVAVRNFYASFLAARYVAKNANKYFGNLVEAPPLQYQSLVLKHPISVKRLKKVLGVSEKELKDLNRALTRYVWHGWRLIPKGYHLHLPVRKNGWSKQIAMLNKLKPEYEDCAGTKYRVRRGDTACGIARAFRVKCGTLIAVNGLNRKGLIRVGQKLTIPGKKAPRPSNLKGPLVASTANAVEMVNGTVTAHRVRPGDTACKIATKYKVNCRELIRVNRLGKGALIQVGQRLEIPVKPTVKPPVQVAVAKTQTAAPGKIVVPDTMPKSDPALAKPVLASVETETNSKALRSDNEVQVQNTKLDADTNEDSKQPPPVVPATESSESLVAVLDNEIDLNVKSRSKTRGTEYFIYVESEETLGHYSDWLGLGSTASIRRLNKLRYGTLLQIGQTMKLPVSKQSSIKKFEQLREEYHRVLIEEFKEHYEIVSVNSYRVVPGDSMWKVAKKQELPIWVVTSFNPQLRKDAPKVGETLSLPVIRERKT